MDNPPTPPRPPLPTTLWSETERALFDQTLRAGADALGVALGDAQILRLRVHAERIAAANTQINLTRITAPDAMAMKHVIDSLTVLPALPNLPLGASLVDVGTGAGYPGIPLAVVRPDLRITLLDSLRKRLSVLETILPEIDCEHVKLIHARAEDSARQSAGTFDVVVARALAPLPTLLSWCAPLAASGGRIVAMKAGLIDDERDTAAPIARQLGLRLIDERHLRLPDDESSARTLLIYRR